MESLSPRISDIQHLVTIPRSPIVTTRWQRTVSAPASAGQLKDLPTRPSVLGKAMWKPDNISEKPFARSKTGAVDLGVDKGVEIYLGLNLLRSYVRLEWS